MNIIVIQTILIRTQYEVGQTEQCNCFLYTRENALAPIQTHRFVRHHYQIFTQIKKHEIKLRHSTDMFKPTDSENILM